MSHWIAKSCGNREQHGQHIHVLDGTAYACFGYTPPGVSRPVPDSPNSAVTADPERTFPDNPETRKGGGTHTRFYLFPREDPSGYSRMCKI